jgi:DNA-binding HxlR family transcriptional regulator
MAVSIDLATLQAALGGPVPAEGCPSRFVLNHVTSKWGVLVLVALADGTLRWGELRRAIEGISEKMLAQTLQTLERDGLVHRDAKPVVPPHVEYSLTPLGSDLAERLIPLVLWAAEHGPDIVARWDDEPAG